MPRAFSFLAPFVLLLMAACGSTTPSPSSSTPSSTPVVTTSPPSTPTPTPASTLPASCRNIPAAIGTPAGCRQDVPDFLKAVTEAVSLAQNAVVVDPDSRETYALVQNGQIQSPSTFLKMIIDTLDRQGLCAIWDGEELNVRNTNAYNEHFDLITQTGASWIKHMSTCVPALPLPAVVTPPVRDPECRLAPSQYAYCDRSAASYDGDVNAALDELIAQERLLATPLIFDFRERQAGIPEGFKVTNAPLYFSELRKKLRLKGYCSVQEGDDELWIKRGTNRFSEHWDLLTGQEHSLRLLAATCRDAAF